MGHDDHGYAAGIGGLDSAGQRLFAFGVEIGVGLIQHDQAPLAVKGAGKSDALALPGREPLAHLADLGVVALRQGEDQLMHLGAAGGLDDGRGRSLVIHQGDVFRDRAGEQLYPLRQETDVAPDLLGGPVGQGGIVDAHGAACERLQPDQRAGQRGLARPRRPDHPKRGAGRQIEADAEEQGLRAVGQDDRHLVQCQMAKGGWQFHPGRRRMVAIQHRLQPLDRGAGRQKHPPAGNRLLDRRGRPSQQDGCGHHQAGRQFVVHDQQRAPSQHGDLQRQPQETRDRGQRADPVRGERPLYHRDQRPPLPAPHHRGASPHGMQQVGVAQGLFGQTVHLLRRLL